MTAPGRHTRRAIRRWERAQRSANWYAAGAAAAAAGIVLPSRMTRTDAAAFWRGYSERRDGAR